MVMKLRVVTLGALFLLFPGCPNGTGPQGEKGEQGAQGPKGDQGASGEKGVPGESVAVVSISSGSLSCPTGGTQFTTSSGVTFACNGTVGLQGVAGPKGDRGDIGPRGLPGASGLVLAARDTQLEGAGSFVSDNAVLSNPGDFRGPFSLATFNFTLASVGSLVTLEFIADAARVECAGSSPSASMGPVVTLSLTNRTTGLSAGGAGTSVANCTTNTNTGGTTINCGPVTYKAAISGSTLPPGDYSGVVRFQARCANGSTSVVLPVTSTISLGPGVLVILQPVP